MGFLRTLLISVVLFVAIGLANAGQGQEEDGHPPLPRVQTEDAQPKLSVPEPNTMLFAGLGGLLILMFAIRRK